MVRRSEPVLGRVTLGVALVVGILAASPGAGHPVLAQSAATAQAPAAQAALPAAREIIDRYVAAIGGAEAIAAISSWSATGTFELPGQGITGSLEVYSARPAKSLVKVTIAGLGDVQTGYDGRVAWSMDPASGPALLTGQTLTQAADDAHFDAVLHLPSFTREMTTVERVTFDGQQAHKVKVVYVSGREQFEYYSVETGLQIGTEGQRETPMGRVPSLTYLRNYKQFGPIVQATELVNQALGIEQVLRITAFDYDNVPDSTFALPPAIQALVKR